MPNTNSSRNCCRICDDDNVGVDFYCFTADHSCATHRCDMILPALTLKLLQSGLMQPGLMQPHRFTLCPGSCKPLLCFLVRKPRCKHLIYLLFESLYCKHLFASLCFSCKLSPKFRGVDVIRGDRSGMSLLLPLLSFAFSPFFSVLLSPFAGCRSLTRRLQRNPSYSELQGNPR